MAGKNKIDPSLALILGALTGKVSMERTNEGEERPKLPAPSGLDAYYQYNEGKAAPSWTSFGRGGGRLDRSNRPIEGSDIGNATEIPATNWTEFFGRPGSPGGASRGNAPDTVERPPVGGPNIAEAMMNPLGGANMLGSLLMSSPNMSPRVPQPAMTQSKSVDDLLFNVFSPNKNVPPAALAPNIPFLRSLFARAY